MSKPKRTARTARTTAAEPDCKTFSGLQICYVCQTPLHGQSLNTVVPVATGEWVHSACRPARWPSEVPA